MTYVKCAGCGSMVQIPDELAGELRDDVTHELTELYYCDECEWESSAKLIDPWGDEWGEDE